MRLAVLLLVPMLYATPVLAEVPLPAPRPDERAEPAGMARAQAADEVEGDEVEAADEAEPAEAEPAKPGRVITITIIGEKKDFPQQPYTLPPNHPARQAALAEQRRRLLEARRARRAQEERARRVGDAVRQAAPFRRRPTDTN